MSRRLRSSASKEPDHGSRSRNARPTCRYRPALYPREARSARGARRRGRRHPRGNSARLSRDGAVRPDDARGTWRARSEILGGNRGHHGTDLERSEEHTSELQSLMRISYAVFCLKKKKNKNKVYISNQQNKHIAL